MSYLALAKAVFGGTSNTYTAEDAGATLGTGETRSGTVVTMEDGTPGILLDGSETPIPANTATAPTGSTTTLQNGLQTLTSGTVADWVVSRERHGSREAIVTTWASGRVEVEGTIEKSHSKSESIDQLPSITDFKADATYSRSIVKCCNGDYTIRPIFISGEGAVNHSGAVYCEWRTAYTGNARINYYYDLR